MLKLYAVSAALRRDRLLDGGGNHGKKVVYYILCTTITIAREDAGAQCQNFITSLATKELKCVRTPFVFKILFCSLQLTQFWWYLWLIFKLTSADISWRYHQIESDPRSPTNAQNMSADVQHVLPISKPMFQLFLLFLLASVFAVFRPTLICPYFMQGCTMDTNNLWIILHP